jgi:hypothetical protein
MLIRAIKGCWKTKKEPLFINLEDITKCVNNTLPWPLKKATIKSLELPGLHVVQSHKPDNWWSVSPIEINIEALQRNLYKGQCLPELKVGQIDNGM